MATRNYVIGALTAGLLAACAPPNDGALSVTGQIEGVTIRAGSRLAETNGPN